MEQAWDVDVEVLWFICFINSSWWDGKSDVFAHSAGNRMRAERWTGPWDSLTGILDMLVGLLCQLNGASGKTWAPGRELWQLLPPAGQGFWLPRAHPHPGTVPLHYTCCRSSYFSMHVSYFKIFVGHVIRLLSQHLESDQRGNINKCDKADTGLFGLLFLLFRVWKG